MKLVLMECGLWGFVEGKETAPNKIVTDTVPAEHLCLNKAYSLIVLTRVCKFIFLQRNSAVCKKTSS